MKQMKKESAVSPVVGVMLMLVITIIIAALVAAFAGGLVENTEPPTNAVIKLESYEMAIVDNDNNVAPTIMVFVHKGGETFNLDGAELAITYNYKTNKTALTDCADPKIISLDASEKLKLVGKATDNGLTRQNMTIGDAFNWAIIDGTGNVIAKGELEAKKPVPTPTPTSTS